MSAARDAAARRNTDHILGPNTASGAASSAAVGLIGTVTAATSTVTATPARVRARHASASTAHSPSAT